MANFELIGYVRHAMHAKTHSRLTIAEYIQGKRNENGEIENEKMDLWFVFFPQSSRRHLARFKIGDQVIVKGTIHQAASGSDFVYAINGECIKHFYSRNITDEQKRESIIGDENPNLQEYLENDF